MNDNPLGPLWQQLATAAARHLLSLVSGFLLAHGVLTQTQGNELVEVGLSLATAGVAYGLSVWQKKFSRAVVVDTAAAPSHPVAP